MVDTEGSEARATAKTAYIAVEILAQATVYANRLPRRRGEASGANQDAHFKTYRPILLAKARIDM